MASRFLRRVTRVAALLTGVTLTVASVVDARPVRRTARATAARGFNLFAGSVNVNMNVNRVQCNINNIGESCVDGTNSPTLPGGFWPRGTGNQYIFNSGLQLAGRVGGTDAPNFPWPGDTVGAFFFDPRGDQAHGEGRTNVFNALNAADLAEWPSAANITDPTLFHPSLLGRQTVSQQDTWVRFWDGNTNLSTGRQHPMGVLVEQRGLAWNFPSGNQDIIYFLYRFINITSINPADYAGLAAVGYSASDIADIVSIAQEFQTRSEAAYNVQIPDGGYPFEEVYAAFAQDPDVTANAGNNFSSANLVFAIGAAYSGAWQAEASFVYPPDINGAPFANAPGFEGVKYLKSPQNIGIAMFGNTTNGGAFPDSRGVQQLWRRLKGDLLASDGTCNAGASPQARHFCFIGQTQADTRFFQSSGPLTIQPGQSEVIVVAYIHAAPLGTAPAATPGQGMPAIPAFTLPIGTSTPPGFPVEGTRLVTGQDQVGAFDRAMGWLNHSDLNGDGTVTQNEVVTQPRSLLNKSLVAQAVFDNKFLLPFAPEAPPFFLVPGNNQVTVAWQPSSTETVGDPYFAIASAPLDPVGDPNALFDPNFRQFDVEGYRIWRGRTQAEMEVIASFDYAGTAITDFTGQFFVAADYGNRCAPELGVSNTCPVGFLTSEAIRVGRAGNPAFTSPTHDVVLAGDIIQVPPGGRVQLASGTILITNADTAITGGSSGMTGLVDNGVPFAFVDHGVRNGFRYFYAVTAFDINSVASGPSSLESPLITKTVTPRAASSNNTPAVVVTGVFGDDDTQLDPSAPYPAIDPDNGTFNGIFPPANAGEFGFLASVAEALPPGEYVARIDSINGGSPASLGTAQQPTMFLTFSAPGVVQELSLTIPLPSHTDLPTTGAHEATIATPLVPYDTMRSRLVGIPLDFSSTARMPVSFTGNFEPISGGPAATMLCGRGLISAANCGGAAIAVGSRYLMHSRFWDLAAAEPADPTINFNLSATNNSGALTGVTSIWAPLPYRVPLVAGGATRVIDVTRYYAYSMTAYKPADYVITWGAGGAVTIRDSTHRTTLPFNRGLGVGYGFYSGAAAVAAGVTGAQLLAGGEIGTPNPAIPSYHAVHTLRPVCDDIRPNGAVIAPVPCVSLSQTAVLQPLDLAPAPVNGTADSTGIVMVLNGEIFFMTMAALPAAGTQWRFRQLGGLGMTATCNPPLPAAANGQLTTPPTDCSNYTFVPRSTNRPPMVPGLQYKIVVQQAFEVAAASGNLDNIHTVPDPYYVTNSLEITANTKILRFVNLPERAVIRVYSASGILVAIVNHQDIGGGGEATWNLRNRNNQFVASGVYFYHVETADGREKVGRFTIVNFAQ